jgi:sec-independent protein translocase protein TatA
MIGDILQPTHLLFILVVALLVLGPKRLPEASRAIGKGIRDFKMAVSGEEHDHGTVLTPPTPTGVTAPYAPVATPTPTPMPPPAEAMAPAPAADPAVTAPEGAQMTAPEPEAEPTSRPTEPAQPVA